MGAVVPAVVGLTACKPETVLGHAQALVDRLIPQLKDNLDPARPVIVSSFVNVDDLETSSTFGRSMSELVGSLLAQKGIAVADVRLRNALVNRPGGELALSREAAALSSVHNAQAVVVGTYAIMSPKVYASVKVVRVADNRILAASEAELRHEG